MGRKTDALDREAYDSFRARIPTPKRGFRRVLFLLGEDGSLLRELAKTVGEREPWWQAKSAEQEAGSLALGAMTDVSLTPGMETVTEMPSGTDLIPEPGQPNPEQNQT